MAARAASSRFCREVSGWPDVVCLLTGICGFLVAFCIDSPFGASRFAGGNDTYCARLVLFRVRDADGLAGRFAIDLAILRGDVVGIVEHVQCGVDADAMLPPVEPILPRIPSKFHGGQRIYVIVYTLFILGRERKRKFTRQ